MGKDKIHYVVLVKKNCPYGDFYAVFTSESVPEGTVSVLYEGTDRLLAGLAEYRGINEARKLGLMPEAMGSPLCFLW